MTLSTASSSYGIYGEGKKLVIGENVTSVGTANSEGTMYHFNLSGGKRWAGCDSTDLTVQSGTWRNIYVGTYGYSSGTGKVTGNAKLTMTGGTLTGFITPAYSTSATIGGNVDIYLSNMQATTIYSCPAYTATVNGDVNITLGEGAVITGSVLTGGLGSGSIKGNLNITLDGADTTGYDKIKKGGGSDYTGTVGSANITIKSGVVNTPITGFDSTVIDIAEGKTLTIQDHALTADSVKSAGTLAFTGAGRLTAKAVTGTVNCVITDEVLSNCAYVTAPAGSGIVFEGGVLTENNGVWEHRDLEQFRGLVLTVQPGVTVNLYSGFSDSTSQTKVEPYLTEGNTKYYPNISGKYHYVSSGTGYYTYHKNIYISPEEAAGTVRIDATPDKKANVGGWEPSKVYLLTDNVLEKAFISNKTLWPELAEVFTTPAFEEGRAEHLLTTQSEMEKFIQDLDDPDDDLYIYSMGNSAYYEHDIPLVVFTATDLSSAKTMEEAAELVKANGKPTIHYRAQIHGNEPASGEGALAVIKMLDDAYGQQVLEKVNIYVIPRMNPDGAQDDVRYLKSGLDANRDLLRLHSSEMVLHHKVFCLFEPEVMLDGHEYQVGHDSSSLNHTDALIASGFLATSNASFRTMSIDLVNVVFDGLAKQGLTYKHYNSEVNGLNPNISRAYTGSQGTLFILIETRGIHGGASMFERRVVSQVVSAISVIDYVAANTDAVQTVVDEERNRIITSGMTYDTDDIIQLETDNNKHSELATPGKKVDAATGEETEATFVPIEHDTIVRSRPAPTAYVIPAGESFTEAVLELMDKQQISYTKLPAGCVIQLQQYTGTVTKASLAEETAVAFPNGAYVFSRNHIRNVTLSMLMEPDVADGDSHDGTLAQQGIITATDGVFPLYRYIRDLNSDGSIDYLAAGEAPEALSVENAAAPGQTGVIKGLDASKLYEYRAEGEVSYTAVAAGSTRIEGLKIGRYYVRYQAEGVVPASKDAVCVVTCEGLLEYVIYLDPQNGNDANDGLGESAAVQSAAQAYRQASAIMDAAPAGAAAKIVLLSDLVSTEATLALPENTFPVVLTSKTGSQQLTHNISDASTTRYIVFNGPTTLENITVKLTGTSVYNYVVANGHKLVIGENVTTVTSGSSRYFNIEGAAHDGTTGDVDLTVLSGTWRNIYMGSYKGAVVGNISFVAKNCTVTALIQPSYSGPVDGNITMELENVTAKNIFCGNAYSGNVSGNVDVTLGAGVKAEEIYAGSRDKGDVGGTVTVTVDGADLTATKLFGKCKTAGTVGKSVLVYKSGTLGAYSDFDEFVDKSAEPEEPAVLRGDMNGDGFVTDADALYLLRHTLFEDRYPISQSGDVNGDNVVTDADALYLLRFTLFEERYPLS